jgi:hypothetical protein
MGVFGFADLAFVGTAATPGGIILPAIGDAFEGGFYAGLISHTADGVATHALIVAPAALGASGTGYTMTTHYAWKTSTTLTSGTESVFDGAANTASMNNADHPAAQFCAGLTINGKSDWYLPARHELDIAYYELKPTTTSNNTNWGANPYSVPRRNSNNSASVPSQTSAVPFRNGNAEQFRPDSHQSSTQTNFGNYRSVDFSNGVNNDSSKTNTFTKLRAFRRIAL